MGNGKTIAQRMGEARIQAGAQNYTGHDYMDLARFDENTRHMIIFHVLTHDSPVGDKATGCACFSLTRAIKKLWRTKRTETSRFCPTQRSFMEIFSMTAKTRYDKEAP